MRKPVVLLNLNHLILGQHSRENQVNYGGSNKYLKIDHNKLLLRKYSTMVEGEQLTSSSGGQEVFVLSWDLSLIRKGFPPKVGALVSARRNASKVRHIYMVLVIDRPFMLSQFI